MTPVASDPAARHAPKMLAMLATASGVVEPSGKLPSVDESKELVGRPNPEVANVLMWAGFASFCSAFGCL